MQASGDGTAEPGERSVILADLQRHFAPTDTALVLALLSEGDHERHRSLARVAEGEGLLPLLDSPGLPEKLRAAPGMAAPSHALLLYVLTRHALRDTGIDDVRLSEYIGALLYEFGWRDRAHRIAPHDDERFRYLTDIVRHLDGARGRRGFLLRAHLGNFTLWLAGVFPDHVTARENRRGAPGFRFYEELGARGFRLASDHRLAHDYDLVQVYRRAAASFGRLRVALNRLSDRVFFPHRHGPDRLLRQVHDAFAFPA